MKNLFLVVLSLVLLLPSLAQAAPNIGTDMAGQIATKAGYDQANELTMSQQIGRYIRVALSLSGTIFLVLTVYAGFLWMTASGNEEQVTKAKDIIMRASLGILITLSAFAITGFILGAVGAGTAPSQGVGGSGGGSNCTEGFFSCWWQGVKNAAQNNAAGVPK